MNPPPSTTEEKKRLVIKKEHKPKKSFNFLVLGIKPRALSRQGKATTSRTFLHFYM
jgi:hypothetical protein